MAVNRGATSIATDPSRVRLLVRYGHGIDYALRHRLATDTAGPRSLKLAARSYKRMRASRPSCFYRPSRPCCGVGRIGGHRDDTRCARFHPATRLADGWLILRQPAPPSHAELRRAAL